MAVGAGGAVVLVISAEFLVVGAAVSESLLGVMIWGFSRFSWFCSSAVGIPFVFLSWSVVLGLMLCGSGLVGGITWGWLGGLLVLSSCFNYFFNVLDCFSYVSSFGSCYSHHLCFGVVVGFCIVFGGYVSYASSFSPYYMGDYIVVDFEFFVD